MRNRWIVAVLTLGLMIAPAAAMAEAPSYLALKLGAYMPGSKTLGMDRDPLTSGDFKAGFNGEVAFGYKFMPNLAAELGIGYFETKADITGPRDFPIDNTIASITAKGTVVPVTLSAKGIMPIGANAELYGLAGVGAYIAKIKAEGFSKSKTAIGFQLGVGGNYNITPEIFLGGELKYVFAKPKFNFDPDEVKVKFDGAILTANIGYRF